MKFFPLLFFFVEMKKISVQISKNCFLHERGVHRGQLSTHIVLILITCMVLSTPDVGSFNGSSPATHKRLQIPLPVFILFLFVVLLTVKWSTLLAT